MTGDVATLFAIRSDQTGWVCDLYASERTQSSEKEASGSTERLQIAIIIKIGRGGNLIHQKKKRSKTLDTPTSIYGHV